MARWRVYVKPLNDLGEYLDDFIEITTDVVDLGGPKQGIDNTDFDVGVIKNSGFNISLRNDHGKYSDVDEIRSIFKYTRRNSIIRVTWDFRDYDLICGFFNVGQEPLGGEYTVFEGLISDVSSTNNIAQQNATFTILGYESILDQIEVPYSSLSNGDTFAEVIYDCINQAPFNELVTVSSSNISLGTNLAIDDKSSLENKTVGGVLQDILLASNSVLYIKDNTVYVTSRSASASVQFTFYGQATDNGIENIINIPKFRDGLNRLFNLWTWPETTFDSRDTTSIANYGVRSKEMSVDVISDSSAAKIQSILDANKTEFAFPKIELDLETPVWYDVLALDILDKVDIDYPTVLIPYDGGILPRYGINLYDGTAVYPYEQWTLTLNTDTKFKILSKRLDVKKQTITFGLREV